MDYKNYVCPTCKTNYVSTNGEKPQGIKWKDGHECDPRSEEEPNPDPVEQEANIPNISSYVSEYTDPTCDPLFYDAYGNYFGDA